MKKNILLNSVKAFVFLLFVNLISGSVYAAVTPLGIPASTRNTDTLTFSVPGGSNRVLVVVASDADATAITSVSFGGTPLTSQAQHTDGVAVDSIWTLALGTNASGNLQNITVVSTGASPNSVQFIAASVYEGVDQSTPLTGIQMADTFGSNVSSSLNVVSQPGDLVFDIFDTFDNSTGGTRTSGGGQSPVHSEEDVIIGGIPPFTATKGETKAQLGGSYGFYNTSTKPGASLVNMSWTSDDTAMIHIAANIKALAPTAAGATVSGRVLTAEGNGIRNAVVYLTDSNGNVRQAVTGAFGNYTFTDVSVNSDYILTAFARRFTLTNPTRILSVRSDVAGEDFVAEAR